MKALRQVIDNALVALSARLLLGFVFVVASIDKIADPAAFATSISYYKIVGAPLTLILATILPWLELLCGLFLLFGMLLKGSSGLVLVMLVGFTGAILSGIVRGLDISCGCFTRDPSAHTIGFLKVFENLSLIALSCVCLFTNSTRFTIVRWNAPKSSHTHSSLLDT